ncbi:MAG TPA: LamG-like jellyroll fold domain-containing protein [Gemmatimonadaceae bacterium]|nr:LamG-like jellyroll fold domain-containing protein [Gemmatimonadaceae bacterium]
MAGALTLGAAVSDRVDSGVLAAAADLNPYTLLAWVRFTTFTKDRVIWSKGANIKALRLANTTGDLQGVHIRGTTHCLTVTTSAPLTLNSWCFVAFVFDANASAGSKVQIFSGRVGVNATAATMSPNEGSGTFTSDAGKGSTWGNNNAAISAALQGQIAYGAHFPGAMALADLISWQNKPRQVVNGFVAVDFKHFGVAGADAIDYAGNANGVVTGATQSTGPAVTSAIDANTALVAQFGGNANLFSIKDARLNLLGNRSLHRDAIGAVGGRAAGITATQANASKRPAVVGEGLVFDGVDDILVSGQDSRLAFDAAGALTCLAIYKASSNGPVCGAGADPTNSALFPQAFIQTAAGKHGALYNPASAGTGSVAPNSAVASNDGLIRAAYVGRIARVATTVNGDDGWHYDLVGRQASTFVKNTQAATVAGGLKECFGGYGTTFVAATLYWQGWASVELTPAMIAGFKAFAIAEFGATVDVLVHGTFAVHSHSLGAGTQTANPLTPSIGSGTTSWPFLVVNTTTPRGQLAARIGLTDVHQYNIGVGGRTAPVGTAKFPHELAAIFDGLRAGPSVLVAMWITNDERVSQTPFAQLKLDMAAYFATCVGAGVTLVMLTAPGYGSGLGGAPNGCYAAPTGTALSSEGVTLVAMNAELRANRALYCNRLIDVAADPRFDPVTRACANATFFNSDQTHPTDAGQAALAHIVNADFDVNGYFWPSGSTFLPDGLGLSSLQGLH